MGHDKENDKPKAPHEAAFFFYGDDKYEVTAASLMGQQIKALIRGFDPKYALMLEGHGNDADREIVEGTRVEFNTPYPLRFYGAPPAQFGGHV